MQPVTGHTHYLDLMGLQAYFLLQLPEHGLFRCFVFLYPTLGKLPGILPDTTPPEQLTPVITQDNADIGSETFRINHKDNPIMYF